MFAQEHAAERLTGAPPGYVGHERGGELTNRVSAQPFSVLLFDEIEKPTRPPRQVPADPRRRPAHRRPRPDHLLLPDSHHLHVQPRRNRHLRKDQGPRTQPGTALARRGGRALQRGGTAPFHHPAKPPRTARPHRQRRARIDIVRPAYLDNVASKFLDQLVASCARKGITLELERESILDVVRREMARPESLALGYREVRNVLDRSARPPHRRRAIQRPSDQLPDVRSQRRTRRCCRRGNGHRTE